MRAITRLFDFKRYDAWGTAGVLLERWTFTDYEHDLSAVAGFAGITWSSIAIKRGEIRYDAEQSSGSVDFNVAADNPVAAKFLRGRPAGVIRCSVLQLHDDGTVEAEWMGGVVQGADWTSDVEAVLHIDSLKNRLNRKGLSVEYRSACWKQLYSQDAAGVPGSGCGVVHTAYTHTSTVLAVSADGRTVTTGLTEADGYYRAGLFYSGDQVRMVLSNTGGVLVLINAISGLAVGDALTAKKGCDHSDSATSGCKSFANYTRFGGHPTVPSTNPWEKPLVSL